MLVDPTPDEVEVIERVVRRVFPPYCFVGMEFRMELRAAVLDAIRTRPIERALADLTPWLFDRQVARLEMFPEGEQIVVRAIMHMDQADRFTQLFVGATGRGKDAAAAIVALMMFIEGHTYDPHAD